MLGSCECEEFILDGLYSFRRRVYPIRTESIRIKPLINANPLVKERTRRRRRTERAIHLLLRK